MLLKEGTFNPDEVEFFNSEGYIIAENVFEPADLVPLRRDLTKAIDEKIEELREAFLHFANKVPFYGGCVVNGDDPGVRAILSRMNRRVITFGMEEGVDFRAIPKESLGDS